MAYDSLHDEIVLFGGVVCDVACVASNETWTFDGAEWHKEQPAASPLPRYGHSMAYDAAGKRVVVFGGCLVTCPANANDTWTWDGSNWTKIDVSPAAAPQPRDSASLVYDSTHQTMVLFGGEFGATGESTVPLGDTWTLSGSTWTQRATTGPSARFAAVAADAPFAQGVLLGGGTVQFAPLGDAWIWSGTEWTRSEPIAAMPNVLAGSALFDSKADRVLLFGGTHDEDLIYGSLRDVWTFDGATWEKVAAQWPQERLLGAWGSMVYDPNSKTTMMIGGLCIYDGNTCDETWKWDGTKWTSVSDDGPHGGLVAYNHATGTVDVAVSVFMFSWDGTSWTKTRTTTFPSGFGNGMASDAAGHLVSFGGQDYSTGSAQYPEVTSTWDGHSWTNSFLPGSPRGRYGGALAYNPATGQTVLFGGLNCNDEPLEDSLTKPSCPVMNDTWIWNGSSWQQAHPANTPPARWLQSLVYDPANDRLIMYGGMDVQRTVLNDAWAWDGTDWTQLDVGTDAPSYFQHGMSISPDGTMMMFGGMASNPGRMAAETYLLGEPKPFDIPLPTRSPSP
jgi:hypothetical protein